MQTAATAALQARADAHMQGLEQGASVGVGASLVLFLLLVSVKKLMSDFSAERQNSVDTEKPHNYLGGGNAGGANSVPNRPRC
jgi:hypothetical protein